MMSPFASPESVVVIVLTQKLVFQVSTAMVVFTSTIITITITIITNNIIIRSVVRAFAATVLIFSFAAIHCCTVVREPGFEIMGSARIETPASACSPDALSQTCPEAVKQRRGLKAVIQLCGFLWRKTCPCMCWDACAKRGVRQKGTAGRIRTSLTIVGFNIVIVVYPENLVLSLRPLY